MTNDVSASRIPILRRASNAVRDYVRPPRPEPRAPLELSTYRAPRTPPPDAPRVAPWGVLAPPWLSSYPLRKHSEGGVGMGDHYLDIVTPHNLSLLQNELLRIYFADREFFREGLEPPRDR
jgi:hypothetical protein